MTPTHCNEPGGRGRRLRSVVDEARGRLEVPVQHEGIKVGAVGPDHGAKLVVYSHLREEVRIGQRLEDRAVQLSGEIDVSLAAVAEAESEPVVTEHLYRCHCYENHRSILRQRIDRLGDGSAMHKLPVGLKLLAVQGRPLGHELERSAWQSAHQHRLAVNRDHCVVLGVLRMEVGRLVVLEVHRDHDAVEEADAGHGAIMSRAADGGGVSAQAPTGRLRGKPEAAGATTVRPQKPDWLSVTNRGPWRNWAL
jgi:hypothetical protein